MKCLANILLQLICAEESQMKPNNSVLTQSHTMAKHHESKPPQNPPAGCLPIEATACGEKKRGFNATKHYIREMRGPYRSMGVWQFTFIGFNMTHCLLAKTDRRLTLKIKTSHHQHFLYTSCPGTDTKRHAQRTSQKAPSV